MNYSLGILSSGVKFAFHLVRFMTNFEFQPQEATKFYRCFGLQVVRMKSSKEPCPQFLITFLLFEILAHCYMFVSFEIGAKSRKTFIP